jgi:peptidoglycan hydrolase CwlO-like protein
MTTTTEIQNNEQVINLLLDIKKEIDEIKEKLSSIEEKIDYEDELTEEELLEIEEAKKEIKEGKFITFDEFRKKYNL